MSDEQATQMLALLGRIAEAVEADAQPEALNAAGAARLIGVSRAKFYSLDSTGHVPQGIDLNGCRRWSRRELVAFLAAGAPHRTIWRQIKDGAMRRTG